MNTDKKKCADKKPCKKNDPNNDPKRIKAAKEEKLLEGAPEALLPEED